MSWVIGGMAGLFALVLTILAVLHYRALSEETEAVRAASLQVIYQTTDELAKLRDTFSRFLHNEATADDVKLRYDILYGRMDILVAGRVNTILRRYDHSQRRLLEVVAMVRGLDKSVSYLGDFDKNALGYVRKELDQIALHWESLRLVVFQATMEQGTELTEERLMLARGVFGALAGLGILLSGLFALLFRQYFLTFHALERERHLTVELTRTNQAVEQANNAKTEFLSTMSHELRTPLNAISGFSQILSNTSLNDQQLDYLNHVMEASHRLDFLISDILDYVELDTDDFVFSTEEFTVASVVQDLCHDMQREIDAQKKDLRLSVKICEKSPQVIYTDRNHLVRALQHIGSNAIKFSERGEIQVRLLQGEDRSLPYVRIEVEDQGIGISKKVQERIFGTFVQADQSLSRSFEGTGLGLAICRKIITLMNGRIGVISEEGKGSTFWVELPVKSNWQPSYNI